MRHLGYESMAVVYGRSSLEVTDFGKTRSYNYLNYGRSRMEVLTPGEKNHQKYWVITTKNAQKILTVLCLHRFFLISIFSIFLMFRYFRYFLYFDISIDSYETLGRSPK